jgi:hypothetical protein
MSIWDLMFVTSLSSLVALYPHLRRFEQRGFTLDPKYHDNNVVGLCSPRQRLRVNLETGDVLC